jgi:hypothetical protein
MGIEKDIKKRMRKGDFQRVAEITGKSPETVRKVMSGDRNNDMVVEAAEDYIEAIDELKVKYQGSNDSNS